MAVSVAERDDHQLLGPVIDAQLTYLRDGDVDTARTIQQEIGSVMLDAQHDMVLITHPEAFIAGDPAVRQLVEIIDDHRFTAQLIK